MHRFKVVVLAVIALISIVVILQNTQDATVRLLVVRVTMPLALLLALMLAGGFVAGLAAALMMGRKGSRPTKP